MNKSYEHEYSGSSAHAGREKRNRLKCLFLRASRAVENSPAVCPFRAALAIPAVY